MAWKSSMSKMSKNLKELRIIFCQTSPESAELRTFVEQNYKELKSLNPKFPILIRECRGVEPQLWARYDYGVEKGIRLEKYDQRQIGHAIERLVKLGESASKA